MAIYGYARCSTNNIKQDISRQTRELIAAGVPEKNIFFEYESGAKTDRRQLKRLLEKIVEGDTIVATEVSRITRSTKQLCEIIEFAKEKKIKLILGDFIVDCSKSLDPMTEGMLKLMGVFAELERNMISERVKSGMANARAKGALIGRPLTTVDDIPSNVSKAYELLKSGKINKSECSRMCGISRPTLYKYINILKENI